MAIWQRVLDKGVVDWLQDLPASKLPDGRVLVAPAQARAALKTLFRASQTPICRHRLVLENDVLSLVERFAILAGVELVDIRLEKVDTDACWKFHLDNVPFRMLTTYRGQTTQWVEAKDEALALKRQRDYKGPLQRLPSYSVAIFKGRQTEHGGGVLHRSPPIEAIGEVRLLLCLNVPSQASPEPWQKPARQKRVSDSEALFLGQALP
jgi:hypothetical protein